MYYLRSCVNKAAFADPDTVPLRSLFEDVMSGDKIRQLDAFGKLEKFTYDIDKRTSLSKRLFESRVLDQVYEIINGSDSDLTFEAALFLAKLGYRHDSAGLRFSGVVLSKLMMFHKRGYGDNACLAFLEFTSQALEWSVNFITNKSCLEFVVDLLGHKTQFVREKALIVLGSSVVDHTLNGSDYHAGYRNLDIFLPEYFEEYLDDSALGCRLLRLDAMKHLKEFHLDVDWTDELLLSRAVSRILFCICRLCPMPSVEIPRAVLLRLLNHSDAKVIQNACLSLSHILIPESDISHEIIDRLGVLLKDESPFIVIPALRIVAHAVVEVSNDLAKLNSLYDCTIKTLVDILGRNMGNCTVTERLDDKEKEMVCHIIGSFCHTGLIKKLSEDKVIVGVVEMIRYPSKYELKNFNKNDLNNEAATTILMFWDSALPLVDKLLVGKQCIVALCHLLVCPAERVIRNCLKGLGKILKAAREEAGLKTHLAYVGEMNRCCGRHKINKLIKTHPNSRVQCLASQFLNANIYHTPRFS